MSPSLFALLVGVWRDRGLDVSVIDAAAAHYGALNLAVLYITAPRPRWSVDTRAQVAADARAAFSAMEAP